MKRILIIWATLVACAFYANAQNYEDTNTRTLEKWSLIFNKKDSNGNSATLWFFPERENGDRVAEFELIALEESPNPERLICTYKILSYNRIALYTQEDTKQVLCFLLAVIKDNKVYLYDGQTEKYIMTLPRYY